MRRLLTFLSRCAWILVACSCAAVFGTECKVVPPHTPSEAEAAFLRGEYDKAAGLYQEELKTRPNDSQTVVGLVDVLLRQQKIAQAADAVEKAMALQPRSAALINAHAEVLYRQGKPWLAGGVTEAAMQVDPCNARLHLMRARLSRLNSLYASERIELRVAHLIDPDDPAIRNEWISTLPIGQRIKELEDYLTVPRGDNPEDIRQMKMYLVMLKDQASQPHKACRLVSSATSTEIPFIMLMRDAGHLRAFGLEVKLNNHKSRLEIDTGASGLLLSRSVADRAGLKASSATELGGIGSSGPKSGYTAYADSIQIGSLEFHDCLVRVLDSRNVLESDGLIGMDVLSHFLVTLDYPMRKLRLGPLPPRPTDAVPETPALETTDGAAEEEKNVPAAASGDSPAAEGLNKGLTAAKSQPTPATIRNGPKDRYVAPEMKNYTKVYRLKHDLLIPTSLNQSTNIKLFILDTGAWTTTISPEAAREVTKLHSDDTLHVHGINGKVDKVYTPDNVTYDFANLRQPGRDVVSFDTSPISKNLGIEVSGLIGAATLSQLTMHIDYRDGLVKFEYDPNHSQRLPPR